MLREQKRFVVTAGLIGSVLLILGGGMAYESHGTRPYDSEDLFRGWCFAVAVICLIGTVASFIAAVGYSLACFYDDADHAEEKRKLQDR